MRGLQSDKEVLGQSIVEQSNHQKLCSRFRVTGPVRLRSDHFSFLLIVLPFQWRLRIHSPMYRLPADLRSLPVTLWKCAGLGALRCVGNFLQDAPPSATRRLCELL